MWKYENPVFTRSLPQGIVWIFFLSTIFAILKPPISQYLYQCIFIENTVGYKISQFTIAEVYPS